MAAAILGLDIRQPSRAAMPSMPLLIATPILPDSAQSCAPATSMPSASVRQGFWHETAIMLSQEQCKRVLEWYETESYSENCEITDSDRDLAFALKLAAIEKNPEEENGK